MPFCPSCGKSIGEEDRSCSACGCKLPQVAHRPREIEYLIPLHIIQSFLTLVSWILYIGYWFQISPPPVFYVMSFELTIVSIGIVGFVVIYGYRKRRGWAWNLGIMFPLLEFALAVTSLGYTIDYNLRYPLNSTILERVLRVTAIFLFPTSPIFWIIVIGGIIIYYLTRPSVKQYFGKENRKEDYQPS